MPRLVCDTGVSPAAKKAQDHCGCAPERNWAPFRRVSAAPDAPRSTAIFFPAFFF